QIFLRSRKASSKKFITVLIKRTQMRQVLIPTFKKLNHGAQKVFLLRHMGPTGKEISHSLLVNTAIIRELAKFIIDTNGDIRVTCFPREATNKTAAIGLRHITITTSRKF